MDSWFPLVGIRCSLSIMFFSLCDQGWNLMWTFSIVSQKDLGGIVAMHVSVISKCWEIWDYWRAFPSVWSTLISILPILTPPNNPFFPTHPFWTPTFFHRKKTTKTTKKPTLFGQTLHFLLQVCYNEFQLQTAAAFTPQTLFGLLGAAGEARLTWKVPLPMKLCLETKRSEGIHDVKMEVS